MIDENKDDLFHEKLLISCVNHLRQTEKADFSFDDILTVPLVYQLKLQNVIKEHRQYAHKNPNHFKEILLDILETADYKYKKSIKLFQYCFGYIQKKAKYYNPKSILLCGLAKSEFKDFLYAIGIWDQKTLNRYNLCEQAFMGEKRRHLEEQITAILFKFYPNECKTLAKQGMRIPQIAPVERPSFDCLVEYAQERGIFFSPRGDVLDLAKETYRYLNLYAATLFPGQDNKGFFYDGLPDAIQWAKVCKPYHELEETVLFHSVKIFGNEWHVTNESGSFAGSMLLQSRIAEKLAKLSELICQEDISENTFRKLILPMDVVSCLPQNYPQSEQTKRNLLMHTVMGTKQYLNHYPDEEWRVILCDWYQKCTEGLTEAIVELPQKAVSATVKDVMPEAIDDPIDEVFDEPVDEEYLKPRKIEKKTPQSQNHFVNKKSGKEKE